MQYKWPGNIRELDNVAFYISFMADSIVIPDHLPDYILSMQESFAWELDVLVRKGNWEKYQEVLEVIADFEALNMGSGRKSIEECLNNKGICLTEGEIRKVLNTLNEIELIKTGIGRRGSEITFKGKEFLKWLKKRKEEL